MTRQTDILLKKLNEKDMFWQTKVIKIARALGCATKSLNAWSAIRFIEKKLEIDLSETGNDK